MCGIQIHKLKLRIHVCMGYICLYIACTHEILYWISKPVCFQQYWSINVLSTGCGIKHDETWHCRSEVVCGKEDSEAQAQKAKRLLDEALALLKDKIRNDNTVPTGFEFHIKNTETQLKVRAVVWLEVGVGGCIGGSALLVPLSAFFF